jgi:hypothetical protein
MHFLLDSPVLTPWLFGLSSSTTKSGHPKDLAFFVSISTMGPLALMGTANFTTQSRYQIYQLIPSLEFFWCQEHSMTVRL